MGRLPLERCQDLFKLFKGEGAKLSGLVKTLGSLGLEVEINARGYSAMIE
jgi:hypothetical protein